MKTKNILSFSLVILLAVIFTSCSTSVDIAKRHFNNGYYVHINSKKQIDVASEIPTETKRDVQVLSSNKVKDEPVVQLKSTVPVVVKEKTGDAGLISASIDSKPSISSKKRKGGAVAKAELSAPDNNYSEPTKNGILPKKITRKENRLFMLGDAPAIVLILLCIFLPPIAVGIVDDWHSKFWFDILLTLLFYFPGMIYAFFICFG